MSILVGKRSFTQNFSEMIITDLSRDNFCRNKMPITEKNLLNRGNLMQISQTQLFENARLLKERFQLVDEKEILTVLDDCDNNVDIAVEILQKSSQPKIDLTQLSAANPVEGRAVRRLQGKHNSQRRQVQVAPVEETKNDIIPEEEVIATTKPEDMLHLSARVIETLQTLSNMDEAVIYMARVLSELKSDTEKVAQDSNKRLNESKSILIKAFRKQMEKTNTLEKKNSELDSMQKIYEDEIGRLKHTNYTYELRLKAADLQQDESHNFDVY